jgi:hypothetical protein
MTKEKIIERFKESTGGLEFLKRCGVQGSQNRRRASRRSRLYPLASSSSLAKFGLNSFHVIYPGWALGRKTCHSSFLGDYKSEGSKCFQKINV